MVLNSRKYIFSKRHIRRCIARTLILSLLASSVVLACAKVFFLDRLESNAHAQSLESTDSLTEHHNYVAITFDDSPSEYTVQLVEVLDSMDVKAAFFITGINVQTRQESIEIISKSGHDIGNHTWDYQGIGIKSARGAVEDIKKTERLIKSICKRAAPFVRPPYNSISDEAYLAIFGAQYRIIYYDIDAGDFFNKSKKSVLSRISCAKAGDIIRFHDGRTTPDTMREVINMLREMGLEPVALSTLLSE